MTLKAMTHVRLLSLNIVVQRATFIALIHIKLEIFVVQILSGNEAREIENMDPDNVAEAMLPLLLCYFLQKFSVQYGKLLWWT